MLTHARDLITGGWRYACGLREFLGVTVDLDEAERILKHQLEDREESFLRLVELGIYANPRNPYRRLLLHAGFRLADVQSLVRELGLETALERLYAVGVYVTLDEFKGRAPIQREGLDFSVKDTDFNNSLLTPHYQGTTSASRGGGSRLEIDFEFIANDALGSLCALTANGVIDRPVVVGQASPPSVHGLKTVFRLARMGRMPKKWFSSSKPLWNRQGLQGRALTIYTLVASRLYGRPMPRPQHPKPSAIVRFLAQEVRSGTPALVYAVPSQAVRICLAAEEAGADIAGTAFFGGGEPYTAGKAEVLKRVGAAGMPSYGMNESGQLSYSCGAPAGPDDMHLMRDKVAVLQVPLQIAPGPKVGALFLTTLVPSTPKLMLNVESGDYAVMEERDCGCLLQTLGFTTHIREVRSYEKLTSEGVMFMGSMLHELLDEQLPARFGGSATDYQLVEEEQDGLPRVSIVVSPRIGVVDEEAVKQVLVESVGFADWSRRMAEQWRKAGTLRVERREPYATLSSKILPLHVLGRHATSPAAAKTKDEPAI
jgi:hypothetical protein